MASAARTSFSGIGVISTGSPVFGRLCSGAFTSVETLRNDAASGRDKDCLGKACVQARRRDMVSDVVVNGDKGNRFPMGRLRNGS